MKRAHYQHGWLRRRKRKEGEVWFYCFREYASGSPKPTQRSVYVGPVSKYRTEADAYRAVEHKRLDVNREVAEHTPGPLVTVAALAAHYMGEELSEREDPDPERDMASGTKDTILSHLTTHIVPYWGERLLTEVKAVQVEKWLCSLRCKPRKAKERETATLPKKLAPSTKAKIRNIMYALYEHATRHEFWHDENPIAKVRQGAQAEKPKDILLPEEFVLLFLRLQLRVQVAVVLDAPNGLRRSELFALQWGDIDFAKKEANVRRAINHNTRRERIGRGKNQSACRPVPLDDLQLAFLQAWRETTEYNQDWDWIFASPHHKGKWPYWPDAMMRCCIRPVAAEVGITKRLGWHSFRRGCSSLLVELMTNGECNIKVAQELMRQKTTKMFLDLYAQALTPAKREAHAKVMRLLLGGMDPERLLQLLPTAAKSEGENVM